MDYFLIDMDKRYTNIPKIKNINESIDRRYLNRNEEYKIPDELVFYVQSSELNNYTDVINNQLFLISEKVKELFERYDTDLKFKITALVDFERYKQNIYYLPIFEEVYGLSEKTEYGFNKLVIKKIVLDYEKIKDKKIFKLKEGDKTRIIARLDVVESLLRRKLVGISYEKLEIDNLEI